MKQKLKEQVKDVQKNLLWYERSIANKEQEARIRARDISKKEKDLKQLHFDKEMLSRVQCTIPIGKFE